MNQRSKIIEQLFLNLMIEHSLILLIQIKWHLIFSLQQWEVHVQEVEDMSVKVTYLDSRREIFILRQQNVWGTVRHNSPSK